MASSTKQAIRASFFKLLNERPLNKITVKDITDDCGVNRNSFYYHYQDIPSLIQEVFAEELGRIFREHPSIDSIEQCISITVGFAAENRRALLHIYNSVNRDMFEQYLWQVCEQSVSIYFNTIFPDLHLAEEDRRAIEYYHVCSVFGLASRWLHDGMRGDMEGFVHRMCELCDGMIVQMVERSRHN